MSDYLDRVRAYEAEERQFFFRVEAAAIAASVGAIVGGVFWGWRGVAAGFAVGAALGAADGAAGTNILPSGFFVR